MNELRIKSERFLKANASTILTYVGAVGVVATSISTAKAATKASALLELAEQEKGEELTKTEKVKVALPSYVPTILFGAATVGCIVGANVLNKRHQATLVSAYGLIDQSYKKYKKKVEELYGEDADDNVKDGIAKDDYEEAKYNLSGDKELFYDEFSGRYFESTILNVQQAEYYINRDLSMRDYAYVNEFYEWLDLPPFEGGDAFGWSTGACLDLYWQNWIDFDHRDVVLDDGRTCKVISMVQEPLIGFEDY